MFFFILLLGISITGFPKVDEVARLGAMTGTQGATSSKSEEVGRGQ